MNRSPRHPKESMFAHWLGFPAIRVGLFMGGVTLFTQVWSIISIDDVHWQTMVFTVLCLSQM